MSGFGAGYRAARSVTKKQAKAQLKNFASNASVGTDLVDSITKNPLYAFGYAVGGQPVYDSALRSMAFDKVAAGAKKLDEIAAGPTGKGYKQRVAESFTDRGNMAEGLLFGAAAMGFGAYGIGSMVGHSSGAFGGKQRQVMMSMYGNRDMAMADAVAIRNPQMTQMRDVDGAYDYMAGNRSSNMPLSARQANQYARTMERSQRRRRRIDPGMYGDGGSLVFAMNDLRRGGY